MSSDEQHDSASYSPLYKPKQQRPRTTHDAADPSHIKASSLSAGHTATSQHHTSTSPSRSSSQSHHNGRNLADDSWQSSLPRFFEFGAKRPRTRTPDFTAHEMAISNHSQPQSNSGKQRRTPARSSSAVPFTESAIDVEFGPQAPAVRRPLSVKSSKSPVRTRRFDVTRANQPQDDPSASPMLSLTRKLGNFFRRRSNSNSGSTSSREQSPVSELRTPSPSKQSRSSRDSTDSREMSENKNAKTKSPRKTQPSRKKYEDMTPDQMMSDAGDVTPASSTPSTPSHASTHRSPRNLTKQIFRDKKSSKSRSSTPVTTELTSSPSLNTRRLPSTPADQPRRPPELLLQLNTTERQVIDTRYVDQTDMDKAINDINQMMTSSTTPTSVSGRDLMSRSGSRTPSRTSSVDSGNEAMDSTDGSLSRTGVEGSFRRTELLPTVRRFIATCQQLSLAATSADHADDFYSRLTDSVHAFAAVLAVSRRATYGQRETDQLTTALKQVGQCYCDMLSAARSAVGLATDETPVLDASKKAATFAGQLCSLLDTVKQLRSSRGETPRVAIF